MWPLATGLTDYLPTCSGEYSPFRTRAPPENKKVVKNNTEADLEGGGHRIPLWKIGVRQDTINEMLSFVICNPL